MTTERLPDHPVDKQGRPLKDRRSRTYGTAPFMGQEGKEHRRTPKLRARQEAFDQLRNQTGRRRPGSLKK